MKNVFGIEHFPNNVILLYVWTHCVYNYVVIMFSVIHPRHMDWESYMAPNQLVRAQMKAVNIFLQVLI